MAGKDTDAIRVVGARVHNLKNVTVEIPKGKLVVFTGLSGSGKSSLAFDTIYAEGQRRYMESLSSYARQFLGNIEKPDVDYIDGLSPAIAIDQQSAGRSPRSTVGTMSEIYDYLRLLYVRVGTIRCRHCGHLIEPNAARDQARTPRVAGKKAPVEKRCPNCAEPIPEVKLGFFSFNSPEGACPDCSGLGVRLLINPELVMPNPRLTLAEGAIRPWARITAQSAWYRRALEDVAKRNKFSLDQPVSALPTPIRNLVLFGERPVEPTAGTVFEGVIPNLERRYRETDSEYLKREIEKYMERQTCPSCQGQRLRPEVLAIQVGGKTILDLVQLTVAELTEFFAQPHTLTGELAAIAAPIYTELSRRLRYLFEVGLGYLTLDRSADTLAGGEAQRIRLATQLGAQLSGIVYILDEPSIGLHPRDQKQLIQVLRDLRDLGNTVIVVEHDEETIREADWIIDVGPGAGEHGGEIIAGGTPADIMQVKRSLTGQYLSGERTISVPRKRRQPGEEILTIHGAKAHNLKNITVELPLGLFVCLSGVSGSGKSTLVDDILAKALSRQLYRAKATPGAHTKITGTEHITKLIAIDQSAIGRTPRSNPATYVGVFGAIRDYFAALPDSQKKKLGAGHFSFNVRGGRCENCRGEGQIKVEMHFLPDLYVSCTECGGQRYRADVLSVRDRGLSIADVLAMSVDEAREFFAGLPQITHKLDILSAVGLGYLRLGQPATTLSGGEAQRVKLAGELARPATGRTLYVLDEPTTGLHFDDIHKLLGVLQALVDKGNTVLVIEHNLDVIKSADWVIDLGPEGGSGGGQTVAAGTPETIAKAKNSQTGLFLKDVLKPAKR